MRLIWRGFRSRGRYVFPDPLLVSFHRLLCLCPEANVLQFDLKARTCVAVKTLPMGSDVEIECSAVVTGPVKAKL